MILEKTQINLVFHGETERTLPIFMEKFGIGESWKDIGGISYKADGKIQRTSLAPQIEDIDEVPLPSNHLVDLKQYYKYIFDVIEGFAADNTGKFDRERVLRKVASNGATVPFITSRGCTNKCSFCYRHMKGYRQHNVTYVINHMKFLQSRYGIRGFEFGDDLFNFYEGP